MHVKNIKYIIRAICKIGKGAVININHNKFALHPVWKKASSSPFSSSPLAIAFIFLNYRKKGNSTAKIITNYVNGIF